MNERKFSVVFGYLKDIDNSCPEAEKIGLQNRLAIVLESYRSASPELYYDYEMFHDILLAIATYIKYDSIEVDSGTKHIYPAPVELLKAEEFVRFGNENDPFVQLVFYNNHQAVCMVRTEFYTAIGGPMPYHDSYTFSFFFKAYNQDEMETALRQLATAKGFNLVDVIHGLDKPSISILAHVKRLF